MEIKVGLSKEFKQIPKKYRNRINGFADRTSQIGYVIVDGIMTTSKTLMLMCKVQISIACCFCQHATNDTCQKGINPCMETFMREVSEVIVHELLHLCDCSEAQIENVERAVHPRWVCEEFSSHTYNLIEL